MSTHKKLLKIAVILLFSFLSFGVAFGAPTSVDITSAMAHPQFENMPEPIKQLFLALDPIRVNLPIFYTSKGIQLKRKITIGSYVPEKEEIVKVEPMMPPSPLPIAGMDVEYFTPKDYGDKINDGRYGLRIAYYLVNSKGEKTRFAGIYAMYHPCGQYSNNELKFFKDAVETDTYNPAVKIRGITVRIGNAKVKFLENAQAYKPTVFNEINYITDAKFVCGRFFIKIWVSEVSPLYESLYYIGNELQKSSEIVKQEDVTKSRDIEPFINDIINCITGLKDEEPPLNVFLDIKADKKMLLADAKSICKISGQLKTKDGNTVKGYTVKIKLDPKYGSLSGAEAKTNSDGKFIFTYTSPKSETIKELNESSSISLKLTITAFNPATGNKADERYITLKLEKPSAKLEVFVHDDENKGVFDRLTLQYNVKGKAITETVFTDNGGSFSRGFPVGLKINVFRKDDVYLADGARVTVPAKVDLLRTTIMEHTDYIKKRIYKFLLEGGFPEEQAKIILNAPVNFKTNESSYDAEKKLININSSSLTTVKAIEDFDKDLSHEIGHYLSDKILDPTGYYVKGYPLQGKWIGGNHNIWEPAQDESKELAFEEAQAHLFAELFINYNSGGKIIYDKSFKDPSIAEKASENYIIAGNFIEGNITSFLTEYYNSGGKNPEAVYKDFCDTVIKYQNYSNSERPVRTIEEFLDAKLNSKSPGITYTKDLGKLAEKYKIKASNIWNGITNSPEAMKNIKVIREGKEIDFKSCIELKKGDEIKVPDGVKVSFQKFSDGYLKDGKKNWVNLGPGKHSLEIDPGYDIIQIEYGKAQFVNTSSKSADGKTIIKKEGTNYIIETDENRNTKISVVEGAVILQNSEFPGEQKVTANQTVKIIPGKPIPAPENIELKKELWWKMPVDVAIGDTKNKTYGLRFPEGWKITTNEEGYIFKAVSPDETKYIQLSEFKVDLKKLPPDYMQKIIQAWEYGVSGENKPFFEKINSKEIKINGITGHQSEYKIKSGKIEFISIVVFFAVKDKVYLFNCVAPLQETAQTRKFFENALEGFDEGK